MSSPATQPPIQREIILSIRGLTSQCIYREEINAQRPDIAQRLNSLTWTQPKPSYRTEPADRERFPWPAWDIWEFASPEHPNPTFGRAITDAPGAEYARCIQADGAINYYRLTRASQS